MDTTLYEQVADRITELIRGDALRPGDRIPSVRALSAQQKVSVSSMLQAYVLLEDRGLIETRPQSGHYVRPRSLRELPAEPEISRPSPTPTRVSVSDLVAEVYGAARDASIVPLGAAYPSPAVLPTARLNRLLASVARRAGDEGVAYDAPPGCLALRRQIARRSLEWGFPALPDDIVTTVGAAEALNLCLQACARPGDTIAIESPTYYGVLQLIESLGMKVLEIPTHPRDGMSIDALASALRRGRTPAVKAVLVTPSYNNPLGACMPEAARRKLVKLTGEHDVPVIEDDIYGDLHFAPERPTPCKAHDRKGLVMLCSSFSKTLAPGYRVGWAIPGRFRERVERLKFMHTVATATFPQLAIAEFLSEGGYDRHLRALRRAYATQIECVSRAVSAHFPPGTRVTRPTGGMVLWVELAAGADTLALHRRAMAAGISIAPGPIFSAKRQFGNFLRLSCGHPFTDTFARAIATLGKLAAGVLR